MLCKAIKKNVQKVYDRLAITKLSLYMGGDLNFMLRAENNQIKQFIRDRITHKSTKNLQQEVF